MGHKSWQLTGKLVKQLDYLNIWSRPNLHSPVDLAVGT